MKKKSDFGDKNFVAFLFVRLNKRIYLCAKLKTMNAKINIYEKFADFLLNLTQLIVGGIIFAAIMADGTINQVVLYIAAIVAVLIFLAVALTLYKISNHKKKKGEQLC